MVRWNHGKTVVDTDPSPHFILFACFRICVETTLLSVAGMLLGATIAAIVLCFMQASKPVEPASPLCWCTALCRVLAYHVLLFLYLSDLPFTCTMSSGLVNAHLTLVSSDTEA